MVSTAKQPVAASFPSFSARLEAAAKYTCETLDILQVNVGSRCNMACRHCHVEAGPERTEEMSRATMEDCLKVAAARGFKTLDITGGAPEMNPSFRWFVEQARAAGLQVIVRSNAVILAQAPCADLPRQYAVWGVNLFVSLPHYLKKPLEKQRGQNTFDTLVSMLQKLNKVGYGLAQGGNESALQLNLVYNPLGAFLPPSQESLEKEYRRKLLDNYGIVFDHLFALANCPLGRFAARLKETNNYDSYIKTLIDSFNPAAASQVMCRKQLSVAWDGVLYDCDFNQAANLPCKNGLTIKELANNQSLSLKRDIAFDVHCFVCSAGAGTSCAGATT